MKNLKKKTITIGIPAYNEELNIKNVLESILRQKEDNIDIKKIIVISDGSTDKTVEFARVIKDKRIDVIEYQKRLGQSTRVSELLHTLTTDILVLIDADMFLKDKDGIEKLAIEFSKNSNVGFVGGNTQPLPAETFIENAVNNYKKARISLEDEFSFENTAYGAHAFIAFSKTFARSLKIPSGLLSHDSYCYFSAISKGYEFSFASKAIVLYRSPQTVKDHISQSTRHLAGGIQLRKYFDPELINQGFYVPKSILLKLMFRQVRRNIFGYIFLKILNIYCSYLSKRLVDKFDNKWEVISTSKKLVIN